MDRKPALALILGLLTATGVWLLEISTPYGLGLIDDAISYIAASRALLAGQGFTRIWLATGLKPITHWPPAFSATLAGISYILKIDPYRSARILNILVFGANAGTLGLLGYKMTKSPRSKGFSSYLFGVLLSALFLSNSSFLRLHAQALSEPLYIFISLLAFLAFARAFKNAPTLAFSSREEEGINSPPSEGRCPQDRGGQGQNYLIITGILTGISYLTRYAALSLIATFIVAIFILYPTWKKRFISLAYFLAGVIPAPLVWILRNKLVAGTATNRAMEWHLITLENVYHGIKFFFAFIIPLREFRRNWYENYSLLAIILSLITFALLFWLLRQGLRYFSKTEETSQPEIIPFITVLYIFGYTGSLLVSLTLFDAATPLNDRILSPVYLAFLTMLVYFIHKLSQQGKIVSHIFAWGLAIFLLGTFLFSQVHTVKILQESPTGFASWRWRESAVMEAIRNLPEDTVIYTNQPPAVYFWTERAPMMIWDIGDLHNELESGDTVLAYFFYAYQDKAYLAKLTEGLTPIVKSGLGNLYKKE